MDVTGAYFKSRKLQPINNQVRHTNIHLKITRTNNNIPVVHLPVSINFHV